MAVVFRLVCLLFLFFATQLSAQTLTPIQCLVIDGESNEPIEFARVKLLHSNYVTFSDLNGRFRIEGANVGDTLFVSAYGYLDYLLPLGLQHAEDTLVIALQFELYELEGVEISPVTPEELLKEAYNKIPENHLMPSYSGEYYYSDELWENEALVQNREAIFLSNVYLETDSLTSEHRLLLYREDDESRPIHFAQKQRDKQAKKLAKKAEANGDTVLSERELINRLFGGPEQVFQYDLSQNYKEITILDSTKFKKYNFYFVDHPDASVYVIGFESKKVYEHMRQRGQIIIDNATKAIVGLDFIGEIVLPAYVKPLLVLAGYRVRKPKVRVYSRFVQQGEHWYPQSFNMQIEALLTKTKLFKKNEHSFFEFAQTLKLNNDKLSSPVEILDQMRYRNEQEMSEQVFPLDGVNW